HSRQKPARGDEEDRLYGDRRAADRRFGAFGGEAEATPRQTKGNGGGIPKGFRRLQIGPGGVPNQTWHPVYGRRGDYSHAPWAERPSAGDDVSSRRAERIATSRLLAPEFRGGGYVPRRAGGAAHRPREARQGDSRRRAGVP